MARIAGAEPEKMGFFAGLFVRLVYRLTKKKVGRVVMPVRVVAHHSGLLRGYVKMEQAMAGGKLVDAQLKGLAELRTATLVGCPF